MSSIFFSGGGGGFPGSHTVRLHPPALLIFTLFQSIICKVNVREYPPTPAHPGFMSCSPNFRAITRLETLATQAICRENGQLLTLWWVDMKYSTINQRQPLNEDVFQVFEASVLRFFIVSFKRLSDEYFLGFFFTIFWSLILWVIFSLSKRDCKSLFVCEFLNLLWCEVKWEMFYDTKTYVQVDAFYRYVVWISFTRRLLLSSRVSSLVINLLTNRKRFIIYYR